VTIKQDRVKIRAPSPQEELIERFSSPTPGPTPEEMHAIVRDGILAEARAEDGWTDESWQNDARHLVGRSSSCGVATT
jgi:hypothetical protein